MFLVAGRNSSVELVTGITESGTGARDGHCAEVALAGGRTARLAVADARASRVLALLRSLRETGHPAYLEIDPTTSALLFVAPPLSVRVGQLVPVEDEVQVELVVSQVRHSLRRDNPDFAHLLGVLEQAQRTGARMAVTETGEHRIIDVRPEVRPPPDEPAVVAHPDPTGATVGADQAKEMFTLVNRLTSCSADPRPPTIPFTYPDDFCWARAHEMCRLMGEAGVVADKVWIYGSLEVRNDDYPYRSLPWTWYVAPVLRVDGATGSAGAYVIDPAMFTKPVPQAVWAAACGDPAAAVVTTSGATYLRDPRGGGRTDPAYADTVKDLWRARLSLLYRLTEPDGGLPPFPAGDHEHPAGVVSVGTLGPYESTVHQERRYPESAQVLWTVVPRSVCAGSALKWTVAVNRNDDPSCDYWVTVTNTSAQQVRYEIRQFSQA